MLAQQALTLSQITGGKLCLGIGLSHRIVVGGMWGMSYDKPVRRDARVPVGADAAARRAPGAVRGTGLHSQAFWTQHHRHSPRPSVVVAALGTQMLRVTGELADGTSTWCVGPNTLRDHIVPTLRQAAADAGRPAPRVVCSLPIS